MCDCVRECCEMCLTLLHINGNVFIPTVHEYMSYTHTERERHLNAQVVRSDMMNGASGRNVGRSGELNVNCMFDITKPRTERIWPPEPFGLFRNAILRLDCILCT